MRDTLIKAYFDYVNNYISLATYAEHNGLTYEQAITLIYLAKEVAGLPHPDA